MLNNISNNIDSGFPIDSNTYRQLLNTMISDILYSYIDNNGSYKISVE
jgi:hypothetical protein